MLALSCAISLSILWTHTNIHMYILSSVTKQKCQLREKGNLLFWRVTQSTRVTKKKKEKTLLIFDRKNMAQVTESRLCGFLPRCMLHVCGRHRSCLGFRDSRTRSNTSHMFQPVAVSFLFFFLWLSGLMNILYAAKKQRL